MLLEKTAEAKTNFSGSTESYERVKKQILERFGPEVAEEYNPFFNCMSYRQWRKNNYQVNRNEKGFVSTVILERKGKDGTVRKYPKRVVLFCEKQVTKLARA